METYIEKRAVGFMKHPTTFVIVRAGRTKVVVAPTHGSMKAESLRWADFDARFTPITHE